MERFYCCPASREGLERIWEKNIARSPDDPRWVRWRAETLGNFDAGRTAPFLVYRDDEPVGEGTLLFSPECSAIRGRTRLADGSRTANVNALRIERAYEGQGHISALMKMMEAHAASLGYSGLTIGVEAAESRNLAVYLHWGYTEFVMSEVEDGALVLYYRKKLN